jgi:glycosyltransferase involved in cell wall biosynthesis
LLLLINNTSNANLILTGKIFEYLASKRPIICIAPSGGDAANIIRETNCGAVFDFDETESLKQQIMEMFGLFKKGKLLSECSNISRFERKNLTGEMAKVLDSLIV